MEHERCEKDVAWVVADKEGKLVAEDAYHGFDQIVLQRIKDYLNPPLPVPKPVKQEQLILESWQECMKNDEFNGNTNNYKEKKAGCPY